LLTSSQTKICAFDSLIAVGQIVGICKQNDRKNVNNPHIKIWPTCCC